ncbi:hypothetical protein ACFL2V_15345 [Pseudomonadota bacterium]
MDLSLEEQRKQKFNEALEREYVGCLFDVDGTLKARGERAIGAIMLEKLAQLSIQSPMAVCTGRNLNLSYEKVATIFNHSSDPLYCQTNWFMICENGAIGYYFEQVDKVYKEMYRVPYPYDENHRQKVMGLIKSKLEGKLGKAYLNEISLALVPVGAEHDDLETVKQASAEIANVSREVLIDMDPKRALVIADAVMGVNIFPRDGNKERGIKELSKFLLEKRGIAVDPEAKDLVCVGDQPQPGGNDEVFLNGKIGTPFTAEEVHPENLLPLPIYDEAGNIIKGPEATLSLISRLKFKHNVI